MPDVPSPLLRAESPLAHAAAVLSVAASSPLMLISVGFRSARCAAGVKPQQPLSYLLWPR